MLNEGATLMLNDGAAASSLLVGDTFNETPALVSRRAAADELIGV
jgi:hypothetical protein